ncbi:hypothetical protein CKO42_19810 [Lamprobacter modestohalophilus]|uniref:Glycosyltransferase 2-like domain-containing protein n=1 Tax=Lamprobacter modestohalophilus TaxID=1064514 RepID=A0A9X0WBR4_9GAMM|nr:glycosyltransferase [Lamprobacter modestohalophilus]MBK1620633.1 hypothetical protein [Lamprobacter modestohalophilus]
MLETQDERSEDRPLVTFALFAYNQEKYIREAVEGALAQTYSPLEIILSDDCSADSTFAVMKDCSEKYKGPHKIVLNRNERNLGIGAHVNKIINLATGHWVIMAAGDDVSFPHRTRTVMALVSNEGDSLGIVHSSATLVSDVGEVIQDTNAGCWYGNPHDPVDFVVKTRTVLGASQCISKTVANYFGDFDPAIWAEDKIYPLRAMLLGKRIHFIEEPLLRYRVGVGVSSSWSRRTGTKRQRLDAAIKSLRRTETLLKQYLKDSEIATSKPLELEASIQKKLVAINHRISVFGSTTTPWLCTKPSAIIEHYKSVFKRAII